MVEGGEQQLLEMAQAGDRTAFDQLQIRLDPELRRFGHHELGATDLVDEILQDAFLAMYLKLEEFADAGHVRFFRFRVVRNLCYQTAPVLEMSGMRGATPEFLQKIAEIAGQRRSPMDQPE